VVEEETFVQQPSSSHSSSKFKRTTTNKIFPLLLF